MLLIISGIPSLGAVLPASTGILTRIGYPLAVLGAYLLGGVVFFDGFFRPVIAAHAPTLLDPNGPLDTPPGVLPLALPGFIFGIGYLLLAIAFLRFGRLRGLASALVLVGSIVVNLPPEPVGPAPLWLIAVGAVILGLGLSWWGYATVAQQPILRTRMAT
jgi:hypothetical protein